MAEYCLNCFNEMYGINFKPWQVKYFSGVDVCEACGKDKKLVCKINLLGEIAESRQLKKMYDEANK